MNDQADDSFEIKFKTILHLLVMFSKKLFLFFLLFGFFVLEINHQTANFKLQKTSTVSIGWIQARAMPDLTPEQIIEEQKALCEQRPGNWMWNRTTCICPRGSEINTKNQSCEPRIMILTNKKAPTETDDSKPQDDDLCNLTMDVESISNKIEDLRIEESDLNREFTSRQLTPDANKNRKRIRSDIRKCENIKSQRKKNEEKEKQCKEDKQKTGTADFSKACAKFARGTDCMSAIEACAMCPEPDEDSDFNSMSCVTVHKQAKCPLLSGKELKLAKEKRDKFKEELEDQEETASDLEKDIVEKQNELNTALTELEEDFINTVSEFERETENAKEDLETQLNENKSAIKNEVSKQIAQIQEVVDKSLEIAHSFENAITKANREYRAEVKKVYAECRIQAQVKLAKYRAKRKQAIESGTYKVSLSSLTNKNRISFAKKDILLLQKYNRECLVLRKSDLKDLKINYQQQMRIIGQQKEQYQHKINLLKQKVIGLNKMAYEQQNQLVQEYAKRMGKIISQHSKQYGLTLKNYNKQKQSLLAETSQINVLQKHLMEQRQNIDQKRRELVTEQQMISYLKSKGAPEEDDDNNEEYSEAAGALEDYYNAIQVAKDSCDCENIDTKSKDKKWNTDTCKTIKRKTRNLDDTMGEAIEKMNPTSGLQ